MTRLPVLGQHTFRTWPIPSRTFRIGLIWAKLGKFRAKMSCPGPKCMSNLHWTHSTPNHSRAPQLSTPIPACGHSKTVFSLPVHFKSSKTKLSPLWPNPDRVTNLLAPLGYPNILHTTLAFCVPWATIAGSLGSSVIPSSQMPPHGPPFVLTST